MRASLALAVFSAGLSAAAALPPFPVRPRAPAAAVAEHRKPKYSVVPLEPDENDPSSGRAGGRNGDGDDDDGTDPVTVVKTVVKTQHPVTHIVTQTARPHTVTRSVATPVTVSVTRSVSVTHASPVIIIVPTGASSGFTIHPTPSALPPTSAAYLPMPSAPAPPYGSPSPSPSDPVEYQPSSDLPTSTAPPYYGPGASAPPSLLVPMPAPTTLSTIVAPPPSWISPSSVVTDWNGQVQPTQAPWPAWNGTTVNPFPAGQR